MKPSRRSLFRTRRGSSARRASGSGSLRNELHDRSNFQLRLIVALLLVVALFCTLFARFFWLQVLQHDRYMTLAEQNRISLVPVSPPRGLIRDRNGVVLAHNYSAYTLEITPSKTADGLDATIERLNQLIEITPKDRRRFKKLMEETKDFESLPIKFRLSDEEVARFAANSYQFPGVEVKARLFRQYPQGELGSHLVGYIGRINDRDVETLKDNGNFANYRGTDHIGKLGVEQSYEAQLHGSTGFERVEVDSGGRAIRTLSRTPPQPGRDLELSVDIKLQEIVEKLFDKRRGALVAIDPNTGGVLAFVSKPGFDPNLFVDGIDPVSWKELNESIDRPLLNRALGGEYPPGSTFKPFMAAAALQGDFPLVHQTIADPGYFMFGNNKFRDSKPGGYGSMNFDRSIALSSDTYFYQLAVQMGIDNIAKYLGEFDFGRQTGIDLPGERSGVLPSPEWKKKRFKKPEHQKWYAGETVSIGIGQGYNSYTPLQLAHATAIIAARGTVYKPHVVNRIIDPVSGKATAVEPQPQRRIDWKPEHFERVIKGMQGVNQYGTGAKVFAGAQYTSAGKTGTAQVFSLKGAKYNASSIGERLRDHSWYIVFAPVENPKIALAVIVENGGFGAQAAAPIARATLDYYLTGKLPAAPGEKASGAAAASAPVSEPAPEEPTGD
ncbi:penicillin-binding protein 2 [Chitinilyticum piscinae]|uniref:Peptidoglycan D,D-transpeptidase MrdA n=1 Tax=Chitinilyticum piscinae TaxID=2866724 RepID=A0A8J7G0I7_9NEIS|nr:penicillin-binding protein 2 [Chitinilyticum piscinae]MBE9609098.1 penicillin-binding protein 2 [Chitinilyticum piscinae]